MPTFTLRSDPVSPPLDISWYDLTSEIRHYTLTAGKTVSFEALQLTIPTLRLLEKGFVRNVTGIHGLPLTEGEPTSPITPEFWLGPVVDETSLPLSGDPLNVFRVALNSGQIYRHVALTGDAQTQWAALAGLQAPMSVTYSLVGEASVGAPVGTYAAPVKLKLQTVQLSALDDEPHGTLTLGLTIDGVSTGLTASLADLTAFHETVFGGSAPTLNAGQVLRLAVTVAARGNIQAALILQPVI